VLNAIRFQWEDWDKRIWRIDVPPVPECYHVSATIHYRPVLAEGTLACWSPVQFLDAIRGRIPGPPFYIGTPDITMLRELAGAIPSEVNDNPYAELLALVQKHGMVEVWAEY